MNSTPPPSQAGVPQGGNGKYIAIALVLVVGIGALVAFKLKSGGDAVAQKPAPSASASAKKYVDNTKIEMSDLVPPPPVEDASAPVAPTATATGGTLQHVNMCDVKACGGSASTELENGLNMVARTTRKRCYEKALANDPSLSGHVVISLKIAANGQVCAANVKSNEMSDPSVASCAANTFMTQHLPAPRGGCANIDMPINYKPAGQ